MADLDFERVKGLVENSMSALSTKERTTWNQRDIDPVVDDLIEIWQMIHDAEQHANAEAPEPVQSG